MKTQISNLINGSEYTIRDLSAEKYTNNPIGFNCGLDKIPLNGFSSGKVNVPLNGGTKREVRDEIAKAVAAENEGEMHISANGVHLTLQRHNSLSGKTWSWKAEITAEQFQTITGKEAPVWVHKNAVNRYFIEVQMDCAVEVSGTSGKKGSGLILGEEFIQIL